MKGVVIGLLLAVAAVNLLPVVGLLVPSQIPSAYDVQLGDDPNLRILLRHRAGLFGIVGALLAAAAFRPGLRAVAGAAGLFSMLSFVAVVWLEGPANAALGRIAAIDLLASVALVAALVLDRRTSADAPEAR